MKKSSKLFDTDMKLNIDIMINDMQTERVSLVVCIKKAVVCVGIA